MSVVIGESDSDVRMKMIQNLESLTRARMRGHTPQKSRPTTSQAGFGTPWDALLAGCVYKNRALIQNENLSLTT
jgi:hypothetical protein